MSLTIPRTSCSRDASCKTMLSISCKISACGDDVRLCVFESRGNDALLQVALTKEVKENIEKALALNPDDGASWHVLGMWHTGVANLNFMMKAALKALFGGMPDASHEKAIECFLKADACKPNLTTTVELAKVYKTVGKSAECKQALEKALTMDTTLPVYRLAQEEARAMLADM